MSVATDRDLLILEPALFRDVSFLGQVVYSGQVSLASGVLTAVSGSFAGGGVGAGHVIVVDERPLEVLERTSGTTATVSLLRPNSADAATVPADFGARAGAVTTFGPQIALVHNQLLRMLGLVGDEGVGEASIVDPAELRLCEALGALHLIYSAASALYGPDSPAGRRAEMYHLRYAAERMRVAVKVDSNGDGVVDGVRVLGAVVMVR